MADHAAADAHGAASAHGAADDQGDEHGHGGEALGPVDVLSWGMAVLGIVLGLVVAWAFIAATS